MLRRRKAGAGRASAGRNTPPRNRLRQIVIPSGATVRRYPSLPSAKSCALVESESAAPAPCSRRMRRATPSSSRAGGDAVTVTSRGITYDAALVGEFSRKGNDVLRAYGGGREDECQQCTERGDRDRRTRTVLRARDPRTTRRVGAARTLRRRRSTGGCAERRYAADRKRKFALCRTAGRDCAAPARCECERGCRDGSVRRPPCVRGPDRRRNLAKRALERRAARTRRAPSARRRRADEHGRFAAGTCAQT